MPKNTRFDFFAPQFPIYCGLFRVKFDFFASSILLFGGKMGVNLTFFQFPNKCLPGGVIWIKPRENHE